jgi:hypothetical protein
MILSPCNWRGDGSRATQFGKGPRPECRSRMARVHRAGVGSAGASSARGLRRVEHPRGRAAPTPSRLSRRIGNVTGLQDGEPISASSSGVGPVVGLRWVHGRLPTSMWDTTAIRSATTSDPRAASRAWSWTSTALVPTRPDWSASMPTLPWHTRASSRAPYACATGTRGGSPATSEWSATTSDPSPTTRSLARSVASPVRHRHYFTARPSFACIDRTSLRPKNDRALGVARLQHEPPPHARGSPADE